MDWWQSDKNAQTCKILILQILYSVGGGQIVLLVAAEPISIIHVDSAIRIMTPLKGIQIISLVDDLVAHLQRTTKLRYVAMFETGISHGEIILIFE